MTAVTKFSIILSSSYSGHQQTFSNHLWIPVYSLATLIPPGHTGCLPQIVHYLSLQENKKEQEKQEKDCKISLEKFRHATALLQLLTCRWAPNQVDRATLLQLSLIFTCRRDITAVTGHRWLTQLLYVLCAFLYISKEIPRCFKGHEIQQERYLE